MMDLTIESNATLTRNLLGEKSIGTSAISKSATIILGAGSENRVLSRKPICARPALIMSLI